MKAEKTGLENNLSQLRAKRGRPRGQGTQIVYDKLREEILRLAIKPGEHIDEPSLERRFHVSRTPIREALIRLRADGLVNFSPNRGCYVSILDFAEIPRVFEALDVLQFAVMHTAASRRTEDQLARMKAVNEEYLEAANEGDHTAMTEANHQFHLIIAEASDNRFLKGSYEAVLNFNLRITRLIFEATSRDSPDYRAYYKRIYDEHNEMVRLLEARAADRLGELSRKHTRLFHGKILEFLKTEPDLEIPDLEINAFSIDSTD